MTDHEPYPFPASITSPVSPWRRRRGRIAVAAVVVIAVVGGLALSRASASSADRYRTATVTTTDVDATLTGVATFEPASQATVAFPISGTVANVDVAVGDTVTAGQTLATLDTAALERARHQAEAAVADAVLAEQRVLTGDSSSNAADTSASKGTTSATTTPSASSAGPSGGDGSSPTTQAQPTTTTTTAPSATAVAAARAAVVAAESDLAAAEQAVAQATIVTPVAGQVVAVNLAPGDAVTAASTTATVVVVGSGTMEATTLVGVDHIGSVKVGQAVTIVPDGSSDTLTGSVAKVSIAPDPDASTTSYRVVIALQGDTTRLGNGATGSVSITTDSARGVLAVPTSAVTATALGHTITVLDGSTTSTVPVQIGAVGATWSQVTAGLSEGQVVVVADLDTPLPSSATSSSNGTTSTGRPTGTFTGGPPVGFTGPPPGN